ncbi:MAG TPA: carboxypeptidase-like regulatory domain-containing protein [Ferruginibacter sp.]|nr:carboxypeptidase-like regulatory domain-containing protein [Ferruginibacter sp.]HPH91140.1 carboxypeptidase-like regulatory domain-containing protein [Ferruginibacter sp.]
MFSHLSKKIAVGLSALVITAMSFFIVSCQKELSGGGGLIVNETQPDLTTKTASAVSGFVTDETNSPVQGAAVQFGASNTTTDKYGYFEFSNVQVVKNAAVVTVVKPGYFKGIKTFIAETGHAGFFRIKLLPKTTQGNFDAAAGGTVTLTNGLTIAFPASAIKLAAGGDYTGQVTVAAQWLNPTSSDIIETMPGDLRGLDADGFMRVLTSYGMSATELTGAGGELLQIKDGAKATVTFPLPTAMAASAPATIPLWHFNETNGLWLEEGSATKNGNTYVGEVSHFSYWNCDLPNATVPLTFDLVNEAGDPVGNVFVDVVPTTPNSWSHAGGYTDATGHVSILVTPNTSYELRVYADCSVWGTPAFTQNFSVSTTAVNLGNVVVTSPGLATVSGTVECNSAPLSDAYVVMTQGWRNYRFPVNNDGTYNFSHTLCSGSTVVRFVAENLSTMQSGTPIEYTLAAGSNTVPALSACVNSIEQFITYTINGTEYNVSYPTDSISHWVEPQATPPVSNITGGNGNGAATSIYFGFDQSSIAVGSSQPLTNFFTGQINDSTSLSGTPLVNITEYGAPGEFIAGNFTCTIDGVATTYNVECEFRVRRRQ